MYKAFPKKKNTCAYTIVFEKIENYCIIVLILLIRIIAYFLSRTLFKKRSYNTFCLLLINVCQSTDVARDVVEASHGDIDKN